jgi:hypothetical protein
MDKTTKANLWVCVAAFVVLFLAILISYPKTNTDASAEQFASDLATRLVGVPVDKGLSTRLYFEAPVAPGVPAAAACEFSLKNGNSVTTSAIDHKTACAQAALQMLELCVAGKC